MLVVHCSSLYNKLFLLFIFSYSKISRAFHSSSAVEQVAVNHLVAGSIPACGASSLIVSYRAIDIIISYFSLFFHRFFRKSAYYLRRLIVFRYTRREKRRREKKEKERKKGRYHMICVSQSIICHYYTISHTYVCNRYE